MGSGAHVSDKKRNGPLVPVPPPADTREVLGELVERAPDALSYDPTAPEHELTHMRCLTDPGIQAALKDGWRGTVCAWAVVPWDLVDERSGECLTLPSLALIDTEGRLVRLTGWPSVNCWAAIIRACGADRARRGIPVVIRRRQSGTAGRSYWNVVIDATARPAAQGGSDSE